MKEYPKPIHGKPKFDDFTEINNPIDFEKLRGDSPLFSDSGEGRFFFQRDGVSYHFVDRWSGLTSYAEIQILAGKGLYGGNICQRLRNVFAGAHEGIWLDRQVWPSVAGEFLGQLDDDQRTKENYPMHSGGQVQFRPMWLQKMGFENLSAAEKFCSAGYLSMNDLQDGESNGFESSFHYYLALVLSRKESEKAGEEITIAAPMIATMVKWGLGKLEAAEILHGKDFTDLGSAHFALKHQLNSQAEIEEFHALGARNAEDYEKLKGAVSGEWKSADDFRAAEELSAAARGHGPRRKKHPRGRPTPNDPHIHDHDKFIFSADDYYLWLEVKDDWPLTSPPPPPYHGGPAPTQLPGPTGTINEMRKNDSDNLLLSTEFQTEHVQGRAHYNTIMNMAASSFILQKENTIVMRTYSLDYLWQAELVRRVIDANPIHITELLKDTSLGEPVFPGSVTQTKNLDPINRIWRDDSFNYSLGVGDDPESHIWQSQSILATPSIDQLVHFVYHNNKFRDITVIDLDNYTVSMK